MQWHFPGQNYTGPGTHILSNIYHHVKPNNKTDFVTLVHDVDYGIAENAVDAWKADYKAIKNADNDLSGIVTKVGLTARSLVLPSKFYGSDQRNNFLLAKSYLKKDQYWKQIARSYDMQDMIDNW